MAIETKVKDSNVRINSIYNIHRIQYGFFFNTSPVSSDYYITKTTFRFWLGGVDSLRKVHVSKNDTGSHANTMITDLADRFDCNIAILILERR